MKDQLKYYFNRYVEFSNKEIDTIFDKVIVKKFKKKDYLLQQGKICKIKFFITKGLVRSFYIDNKGNEKIVQFAIENWWVTNFESFVKNTPSSCSIQAIEDTTSLIINREDLEQLYVTIPKLERVFRIITENMLIALQRRNQFYLKLTSKERYFFLMNSIPDFVQRVPQYMIASYLEITPEYLSEIRKIN